MRDSTFALMTKGYAWLPDLWRRRAGPTVRTRLMGQPAVGLRGPDAVQFFYDERHIERRTALPEPILSTLFGHGAVHTLDGEDHRVRKGMFVSLLMSPDGSSDVAGLLDHVTAAWDEAVTSWTSLPQVVLFDATSQVITRGVCRWAGVPVADDDIVPLARDLVAMVDGFATPGPRHWRARLARKRREAWLAGVIDDVRSGKLDVPEQSVVGVVARHRDRDGSLLEPRVGAVEVLNVIRPTAAVCWFVTFAAHALHLWPEHRERLQAEGATYARAFAHELRRFYPFAPFIGGRAVRDVTWRGEMIPRGAMVLLDLYGQNHDGTLWPDPYTFDPSRFLDREISPYELVPQGGDDPRTGHRCPGEPITVMLLQALSIKLAQLEYDVPKQDLTISLRRIPARPRSGFVLENVRLPGLEAEKNRRAYALGERT